MISHAQLNHFREQLLKLMTRLDTSRQQLKDETMQGTGGESSGGISSLPLHLGDLGSHEAEEDIDLRLLENEEELIREVGDALERIEQGTFGQCKSCKQPIGEKRLNVVPYARYCIKCATEIQKK